MVIVFIWRAVESRQTSGEGAVWGERGRRQVGYRRDGVAKGLIRGLNSRPSSAGRSVIRNASHG